MCGAGCGAGGGAVCCVATFCRPCATLSPIEWMSGIWASGALTFMLFITPNSAACLTPLTMSLPPLAKIRPLAPDCCAFRTYDEKSWLLSGCLTEPTTLPPAALMKPVASSSIDLPNT